MKRVVLLIVLLLPLISRSQCMSGTYTIGGATPDYATITAAAADLNLYGVCGPVVFNIRSGVYTEQFSLTNIAGSSFVNTITFQSEALDSTAVTVQYGAATTANYHVIKVVNANHVCFYKLHILNTSSAYSTGIYLTGVSIGCEVRNCILESTNSPGNAQAAGVYVNNPSSDSLLMENCRFLGNSKGFSTGTITTSGNYAGIRIRNCGFYGQNSVCVYIRQGNRAVVENCIIEPDTNAAGADGIVATQYCLDDTIRGNRIIADGSGIAVTYNSSAYVYNNFVTTTGAACITITSTTAYVYHNTLFSRASAGEAVIQSNVIQQRINKNVIVHSNGGPLYDLSGPAQIQMWSNQNILYTTGSVIGICNSVPCYNLGQWYANTSMDFDSRVSVPQFVSSTDFHVTSDFSQNMVPDSLPSVTNDIDGDPRNLSTPYPGADEATIVIAPLDASAVAVSQPSSSPVCGGMVPFGIVIRNQGSLLLTSVNVNWKLNGIVQTPVTWNGFLAPGDTTTVLVGPAAVSAGDSITVEGWTDSPNMSTDPYPQNDSFAYAQYAVRLTGTYTIGGTTPDFPTFTDAVNKLIAHGVCGHVIFNVRNGTYAEQITVPLIDGASDSSTITFQSEAGDSTQVILTASASASATNYTLRLDNARYVSFYRMTIRQQGNQYNTAVRLINSNYGVNISNCVLTATGTPGNATEGCVVYGSGGIYRTAFDSCAFTGGYFGVRLSGSAWYNMISYCNFYDHSYAALDVSGGERLVVTHNTYIDTAVHTRGFAFTSLGDSSMISYNRICGKMISGIYCSFLNATDSVPKPIVFFNNMISVRSQDDDSTTTSVAFFMSECSNTHVLFNNFYNYSPNASPNYMMAMSVWANAVRDDIVILNNQLKCENEGTALLVSYVQPIQWSSNYNNLYSVSGSIARFGTTNYCATLAAWQAASGGNDMNSINWDPAFIAWDDLHIFGQQGIDAGTPIAWITDDFDTETRSTPPDIGADEFGILPVSGNVTSAEAIRLYPNPASAAIEVVADVQVNGCSYSLVDVTGRTVQAGWLRNGANTIDVSMLQPGMYMLVAENGSSRPSVKFMITE